MKVWQKRKLYRDQIRKLEQRRALLQEQIDALDEKIVMTSIKLAEFDLKDRIEKKLKEDQAGLKRSTT